MYFTKVKIENYGSIKKFEYNFRFNNNENPVPLIIVGQNGTGKTLLLANLVDALIEFKRDVYGEHIYETEKNKFFKIGSQSYIRAGESFSHVLVEAKNQGKTYKYIDIMSKQPKEDVENGKINRVDLKNPNAFYENGFSKKIIGSLTTNDYKHFIQLYFPSDRYYTPMWYVPRKKDEIITFEDEITYPKSCLIKKNLVQEIKEWVHEVFLERYLQQQLLPNDMSLPQELRGQVVNIQHLTPLQNIINDIFSKIKGTPSNVAENMSRKQKSVSIGSKDSICFDISQLSQGEINLFAITLSIVKEWDLINNDVNLNNIVGTVVIDEADLGLHIDYAYRALPVLMQLFPKVQFVLTAHSPFLLAGIIKTYNDNVDIISMPNGQIIKNACEYFETKRAEEIVLSIRENTEDLENKIKELELSLGKIKSETGKVYLYTEGETDAILLNKAKEKLGITDLDIEILPINKAKNQKGNDAIVALLDTLRCNVVNNNIVIGLIDRDVKQKVSDCKNIEYQLNDVKFAKISANTAAFALPVPHNRVEVDQISIEHYFTNDEIMRENEKGQRLFFGNEFNITGNHNTQNYNYHYIDQLYKTIKIIEHETKKFVTDQKGNGDYSLSKKHFAEAVRDDRPNFNDFDFSEFNKIFDVVREIIKDIRGE